MAFNFGPLLSAACGGAPRRLGRLRRPWARCARLFLGGYQHRKIAIFWSPGENAFEFSLRNFNSARAPAPRASSVPDIFLQPL